MYCSHYRQPFSPHSTCGVLTSVKLYVNHFRNIAVHQRVLISRLWGGHMCLANREGNWGTSLMYFSQPNSRERIYPVWFESIYPKSWLFATLTPVKYILNEWMTGPDMVFQSDIAHQLVASRYSSKWIFKPCAIQETPVVLCTCNKDTASVFCFALLAYEAQVLSFSVLFKSGHLLVYFLLHTV